MQIAPTRPAPSHWKLCWSDEFNGPDGSPPDPKKWSLEVGGDGFGNHELEYYTARPCNAFVEGGNLVIQALREPYTGADGVKRDYTSARLNTFEKFSHTYGRMEARIKIPKGQGMWPAFWMLGADIGKTGWPQCGEIDIMENIGNEPSTVHGTVHGPGYSGGNGIGKPYQLPDNGKFADDFHVYAVEWKPDNIRFYVDDHLYHDVTPKNLPPDKKWAYNHPFSLLLNVAVGGDWPGPPDATTEFPQRMLVDYVRVYEHVYRASEDSKPTAK